MKLSEKDIKRFWSFVDKRAPDECWLWTGGGSNNPYDNFSVGPRESAKTYLAHRVSYYLEYGVTDLHVCHKCDVPRCVNPAHLFAGTQQDNRIDCMKKGRVARGPKHGRSVLDEDTVRWVVGLSNAGLTCCQIAEHTGHRESTIWNVVQGRTWSWLTGITSNGRPTLTHASTPETHSNHETEMMEF